MQGRRIAWLSASAVLVEEALRMLALNETRYPACTVTQFHERSQTEHCGIRSYSLTKKTL